MTAADTGLLTVINGASVLVFSTLACLCLFLVVRSKRLRYPALFLGFSFILILLVNFSNVLEYLGITAVIDTYEEYFEVLFMPFILLFCYSWTSVYVIEKNARYSRELHHRVKNNLQIIESLLAIQKACMDDPAIGAEIDKSRKRILSIGLAEEYLHENDGGRIPMTGYLEKLVSRTGELSFKTEKPRIVKVDCPHIILNPETAISCGLVVNELLLASTPPADEIEATTVVSMEKIGAGEYRLSFSPYDRNAPGISRFSVKLIEMLCSQLEHPLLSCHSWTFSVEFATVTREELRWQFRK